MEDKPKLLRNPRRREIRNVLARIRREIYNLRQDKRVRPLSPWEADRLKELTYKARRLSYRLRKTAPYLKKAHDWCGDVVLEPTWWPRSFNRFRHSSRAKRWTKQGGQWVGKRVPPTAPTSSAELS